MDNIYEYSSIDIFDEEIEYIYEDNDKLKVLMIHGYGSSYKVFLPLITIPDRNYDIVAINLPVFNDDSDKILTIEYLQTIVNEFVNKIGFENLIVVSHSLGAAMALAIETNELEHVILLAPFNYYDNSMEEEQEKRTWLLPENIEEAYNSVINLVHVESQSLYVQNANKQASIFLKYIQNKKDYLEELVDYQILNNGYLDEEIKPLYTKFNNKELTIVSGVEDKYIKIFNLEKISKELDIKLEKINNCGHAIIFEKPKEVNSIIEKIVAKFID